MGRRGFPPKPTEQRIREGNRGRRPLPTAEPKPRRLTTLPDPPASLEGPAVDVWHHYGALAIRDKVLADTDLLALEMLCLAWYEVQELVDDIRENGRTEVVGVVVNDEGREVPGTGATKARPEVGLLKEAKAEFRRWCASFGWSPADRTRVQVIPDEKSGDGESEEERLLRELEGGEAGEGRIRLIR